MVCSLATVPVSNQSSPIEDDSGDDLSNEEFEYLDKKAQQKAKHTNTGTNQGAQLRQTEFLSYSTPPGQKKFSGLNGCPSCTRSTMCVRS
ncbi:hypothetical protein TRAPUB_7649 [Trametes pubescens]|uniref:Uncharacterized protein n=1 Tax=Trametes pubescens TaxID=154538 RepID=A0A1M2V2Q7_TRAPU|nr:hypothetical protein TRAPUB_7649 [Trametes pubescens]